MSSNQCHPERMRRVSAAKRRDSPLHPRRGGLVPFGHSRRPDALRGNDIILMMLDTPWISRITRGEHNRL